jgi:hypothetical protein
MVGGRTRYIRGRGPSYPHFTTLRFVSWDSFVGSLYEAVGMVQYFRFWPFLCWIFSLTSAAAEFEVCVQAKNYFQPMTSWRSQTKEWLPWFNFITKYTVECIFCKKLMSYRRDRCLEHYGYQAKSLRAICTKMSVAVRERFKDCGNVVPGRMSHVELYAQGSHLYW